jgi:hypothetical protein
VSQTHVSKDGTVQPVARGNRRATVRYRCAPATVGKVISATDQEFQRAWLIDLSLTGVGMQVSRPMQTGHLAIIAIRGNDGGVHEFSVKIKRCSAVPQGDWCIGCEFTVPLTPDQLEQLL